MKFLKSSFSIRPKGFDTVDMIFPIHKFIFTMSYPEMSLVTHINEAIISSPVIRMYDTIRVYFASNNALKGLFSAIWDDFCVNLASALDDSENRCFTTRATTSLSFYSSGTEVRFIDFNDSRKRRGLITKINDAFSN